VTFLAEYDRLRQRWASAVSRSTDASSCKCSQREDHIQHKERAAEADVREIVTGAAAGTADLRAEIEQLREAMDSRAVIEQAAAC